MLIWLSSMIVICNWLTGFEVDQQSLCVCCCSAAGDGSGWRKSRKHLDASTCSLPSTQICWVFHIRNVFMWAMKCMNLHLEGPQQDGGVLPLIQIVALSSSTICGSLPADPQPPPYCSSRRWEGIIQTIPQDQKNGGHRQRLSANELFNPPAERCKEVSTLTEFSGMFEFDQRFKGELIFLKHSTAKAEIPHSSTSSSLLTSSV